MRLKSDLSTDRRYYTKLIAFLLVVYALPVGAQAEIQGTWYRNDVWATAVLVVTPNMHFHIEAVHTAHSGVLDGVMEKIQDGLYFSRIDVRAIANCLFVFSMKDDSNLKLRVYGNDTGAGATAYYDGDYVRNKISNEQMVDEKLDIVLDGVIDTRIVRRLLGPDLDYFVECFAFKEEVQVSDGYLDECFKGVLTGAATGLNGIFAVQKRHFYTMFLDSRQQEYRFQYYTNDPDRDAIPSTFVAWMSGRTYKVEKHVEP